jgi:hypothetical protein
MLLRRAAITYPLLLLRRRRRAAITGHRHVRPLTISRTTKEGAPGERKEGEEEEQEDEDTGRCDDKKESVAAGRIVTPEWDKQGYAPEGMGMDPADATQGTWLKPGVEESEQTKGQALVEDKITGEKLRDTDVLVDRKSG